MKKILLAIALIILGFVGFKYFKPDNLPLEPMVIAEMIPVELKIENGPVNKEKVKAGTTALEFINSREEVETKGTGTGAYVVSINGRLAEEAKKEFWSFYVNGKMAEVGAGSYILNSGDKIEWKIEKY